MYFRSLKIVSYSPSKNETSLVVGEKSFLTTHHHYDNYQKQKKTETETCFKFPV